MACFFYSACRLKNQFFLDADALMAVLLGWAGYIFAALSCARLTLVARAALLAIVAIFPFCAASMAKPCNASAWASWREWPAITATSATLLHIAKIVQPPLRVVKHLLSGLGTFH